MSDEEELNEFFERVRSIEANNRYQAAVNRQRQYPLANQVHSDIIRHRFNTVHSQSIRHPDRFENIQSERVETGEPDEKRRREDNQTPTNPADTPILQATPAGLGSEQGAFTTPAKMAEPMQTNLQNDDAGAENNGNMDAEAAGFGLGRIRPLASPYPGRPKACTRIFKKRMHFYVTPKTLQNLATRLTPPSLNTSEVAGIAFMDWIVIPWKSAAMYMNVFDYNNLKQGALMYNYKKAKFNITNFSTHQATVTGSGSPQININMSGVAFESIHISSKEIGPWFIGQAAVGAGGLITSCTSFSWNTSVGIFNTQSINNNPANYYQLYPYRLIQIIRDAGDELLQNETIITNNLVNPNFMVANLSSFSEYGFAQPPISGAAFTPKKKWRQARVERPTIPRRLKAVSTPLNVNMFHSEFTAGLNITNALAPAAPATGSQFQKEGHIATFRGAILSDYAENICPDEFNVANIYGSSAHATASISPDSASGNPYTITDNAGNELDMFGVSKGGDPQKDLYAFRIITPPNPISTTADSDLSITFTIETELEVEYIPVVENTYMSRNHFLQVSGAPLQFAETTDFNLQHAINQMPDPMAYSIPNFNAQYAFKALQATIGPRGTDTTWTHPPDLNSIGY